MLATPTHGIVCALCSSIDAEQFNTGFLIRHTGFLAHKPQATREILSYERVDLGARNAPLIW